MFNNDYLNLNEKQSSLHLNGPALEAGSGKTKVLTSRIAHIIKSHKPFLVKFLITFTNKAQKKCR